MVYRHQGRSAVLRLMRSWLAGLRCDRRADWLFSAWIRPVCVCERITSTELTVEMFWDRYQDIVFPFVTIKAQWCFNALVPPFSLQKRLVARRDVVETYIFINYRKKQREKYSRVRNKSVTNTSQRERAKHKRKVRPCALNIKLPIPAGHRMHQQRRR